jgi:prefoldin subunit 5
MTIELNNEEKIGIVNQHIKNLAYNKYNLQMTIAELEAVATPSQIDIDDITAQIATVDLKISALNAELATLQA